MGMAPHRALGCLVTLVAAVSLPGCGGSAANETRRLHSRSVIEHPRPVPRFTVTPATVAAAAADSAERAFLEYWRNLQQHAWSVAASTYAQGLRTFLGSGLLTRALEAQARVYRASRPVITTSTAAGDRTTIRYRVVNADGQTAATISWAPARTGWAITYDSLLDQALAQARQEETQLKLDPLSQRLQPAAIQAGMDARNLQSEYAAARASGQTPLP